MIVASAPAKVILFGEHAVVYGYPSIAAALDLYVHVRIRPINEDKFVVKSHSYNLSWDYTLPLPEPFKPIRRLIDILEENYDISLLKRGILAEISSDIPPACGLGTSAACSVAFTSALLKFLGFDLEKKIINQYAYEAEKISHGNPSGIDNTISTYGGLLLYVRGNPPSIHQLDNPPDFNIILVDTSIPRNTKKAVLMVADLLKRYDTIKLVMDAIGDITRKAWDELQKGGNANLAKIGELMNINHGLLSAIGVSSKKIEEITHLLREIGAYGSKLTGAGIGGFVIGVSDDKNIVKIKQQIEKRGYRFFISKINKKGVQVYEEK